MGGHSCGDIASQTARDAIANFFAAHQDQPIDETVLKNALEAAHQAVMKKNEGIPAALHMLTTATIVHIKRRAEGECDISVAYVGDSPAYVIEPDGRVQEMIYTKWMQLGKNEETLKGSLLRTPKNQRSKLWGDTKDYLLNRNSIASVLGRDGYADISTGTLRAKSGAKLLLASDGITGNLLLQGENGMVEIVNSADSPDAGVKKLVATARTASQEGNYLAKPDDGTAIVVEL